MLIISHWKTPIDHFYTENVTINHYTEFFLTNSGIFVAVMFAHSCHPLRMRAIIITVFHVSVSTERRNDTLPSKASQCPACDICGRSTVQHAGTHTNACSST